MIHSLDAEEQTQINLNKHARPRHSSGG
jgi:hypothetical protein